VENRKIIAIDIDGIICEEPDHWSKYYEAKPIWNNIEIIRKLYNTLNVEIVLYSARYPEDRKVTEEWLQRFKIPYHRLVLGKLQAHYYIDDRLITLDEICKAIIKENNKNG